jgi:hypothetical protein
MSKHLYFFMSPQELPEMQTWLIERDVVFLRPCCKDQQEMVLDSLLDFDSTYGWSTVYFTPRKWLPAVVGRLVANGRHYVNFDDSPLVEFGRPVIQADAPLLARSRLYAQTPKTPEFNEFVSKTYAAFKKQFLVKYPTAQADFATRGGQTLIEQGYEPLLHLP